MRFPALDGLRGLAAVAVVFNHLGPTTGDWWLAPVVWFGSVGWFGVDLFFVLSGFLITGILIENKNSTNYFRAFYTHRALRILPVYVALLVIWTIIIPWLAPDYFKSISAPGVLWPHWLFLSSLWIINEHILMAWVTPLSPNWSLAIEEQFYCFWAPIVRWLTPRDLATLALVVLVAGIGLRFAILPGYDPRYISHVFFFTLTHLDGLCIGILARLAYNDPSKLAGLLWLARTWWLWAIASAAILIVDANLAPKMSNSYGPVMLRVGFTALSMLSAAVMMHGILIDGWARRVFDIAPLRQMAVYSYFVYMFHVTIAFAVAKLLPASPLMFVFQCMAILATAELSRVAIEGPCLNLRKMMPFKSYSSETIPRPT